MLEELDTDDELLEELETDDELLEELDTEADELSEELWLLLRLELPVEGLPQLALRVLCAALDALCHAVWRVTNALPPPRCARCHSL